MCEQEIPRTACQSCRLIRLALSHGLSKDPKESIKRKENETDVCTDVAD